MGQDEAWRRKEKEEDLRIFTQEMKKACWEKATRVEGRDPDRWRKDAVGNIVCRKLTTCEGCLCHEYDHIIPYSRGGKTELNNCQILQTRVNRMKGNMDQNNDIMKGFSCSLQWTMKELDIVEAGVYGDVRREDLICRCKSVMEMMDTWNSMKKSKKMRIWNAIPNCTLLENHSKSTKGP